MAPKSEDIKFPLHFDTLGIHAGQNKKYGETGDIPIYASTSFVFRDSAHGAAIFGMKDDSFCYSRLGNPTILAFEERLTALEGGKAAVTTASGPAALFLTITALGSIGSNILIASEISDLSFNQFSTQLSRFGIEARFISNGDIKKIKESIDENTKGIFIESLPVKGSSVSDIRALADVAHLAEIPLIVDNTGGAGGYLIKPIEHGADIVIQSASEWLSISGSNLGGIIVDSGAFPWNKYSKRFPQFTDPLPAFHGIKMWETFGDVSFAIYARAAGLRDVGPCNNPFEVSQLLLGLETLSVRMERISKNALELAEWLEKSGKATAVVYPGLPSHPNAKNTAKYLKNGSGGVISLAFESERIFPESVFESLNVIARGDSIGGSKTKIITHYSSFDPQDDHQIRGLVHVSVGLEHIGDIIEDFERLFSFE